MQKNTQDDRGRKIIFLSHCILNQNAKVEGIATYPGMIKPVVESLLENDIAIYQMPCPEMTYIGAMRWSHTKDQYNSPMFRKHCQRIASETLDQAEEYLRAGYQIVGIVMVDGSPVCGLRKTHKSANEDLWGGMVWYLPESKYADDSGVYCTVLNAEVEQRGLSHIPLISLPESVVPESMDKAVEEIAKLF